MMGVKRPGNRGPSQLQLRAKEGKLMVKQGGFGCAECVLVPKRRVLLRTVPRTNGAGVEAGEQSRPQRDDHLTP